MRDHYKGAESHKLTSTFKGQADRQSILDLLVKMVGIESINKNLEGGSNGEKILAEYVEEWGVERGFTVSRDYVDSDRFNVLIELPGNDRSKRLLLEAHMDTVPVGGMTIHPFSNGIRKDRVWGRGSCDDKGSLAAMMSALDMLKKADIVPAVNVMVAATVGEEFGHSGIRSLLKKGLVLDAAVVGEPTDLKVVRSHKGNVRWSIMARGVSAHASVPDRGVNAIYGMCKLVNHLRKFYIPTLDAQVDPILGKATFNVGRIEGGLQANIVPDRCSIKVERRLLPGESPEDILRTIQSIIESSHLDTDGLIFEMDPPGYTEFPLETPTDAPIVNLASNVCQSILGYYEVGGVPYGTDASDLAQHKVPTIVFGPGSIADAHSADESIEISQVVVASEVYAQICALFT